MNSTVLCRQYLEPNPEIVGIGIRVSVYVQSFSCIALLLFPTADELLKNSFRASILTMYAIGFAFFTAHHTGSYSLQAILVAHCFVDILLLSSFSLMCFRRTLRKWQHVVVVIGGIPFALWTLVQAGTRKTDCYDSLQFETVSVDSHTLKLYLGFWIVSGAIYLLSVPVLFLLCFPKACSNLQPGITWLAVFSWTLASISTVVVSEVIMATTFYRDSNNNLTTLNTTEWGFGQVFAVVMLFFVIWDLVAYPFGASEQSRGSRLSHWWTSHVKPRHPWLDRLFGGCITGRTSASRNDQLEDQDIGGHFKESGRESAPVGSGKDEMVVSEEQVGKASDIEQQRPVST